MRDVALWLIALVWLGLVAAGLFAWERYQRTPGESAVAAGGEAPAGRWRLSAFVHPRCPCGGAMLDELNEIRRASPDVMIRVVFVHPDGVESGWERGPTWDAAVDRNFDVFADEDGSEARRSGAKTSGQAILIDPAGRVVFRGGLTRGRGVTGESPGRRAVLGWMQDGGGPETAPVYGCPLFND